MPFDENEYDRLKAWDEEPADPEPDADEDDALPPLPAMGAPDVISGDMADPTPGRLLPEMDFTTPAAGGGVNGVQVDSPPRLRAPTKTAAEPPPAASMAPPDWKSIGQRLGLAGIGKADSRNYESLFANAGNVGAYRPNPHAGEVLTDTARLPVDLAKEQQGYDSRDMALQGQKSKIAQTAAERDPNSLQSQKARNAIKAMGLKLPEGFEEWSAADVKQFTDTGALTRLEATRAAGEASRAKTQAAHEKAAKADAEQAQMRKTWAAEFKKANIDPDTATKYDLERLLQMRGQNLTAAALAHREGEDASKKTEDIPPGYELTPGAQPSGDSRKKFTALVSSQQKMKELTAAMREELRDANLADRMLPGEKKRRLQQLATQMRIEAKNVAELGALSGPDMGLIESIATDPTSLQSLAGGSLDKNLAGLDSWADSSVRAGEKSYGLRRMGGGGKVTPSGKPYAKKQQNPATKAVRYLDEAGNVIEQTDG